MLGAGAISTVPVWLSPPVHCRSGNFAPRFCSIRRILHSSLSLSQTHYSFLLSSSPLRFPACIDSRRQTHLSLEAASSSSSVVSAEYTEEPATNVKFQMSLSLPGCSGSLALFGTGYREKVFAIIGVKVYAAGLYLNESIISELNGWKGRSAAAIQEDSSFFKSIFQTSSEKSLQIVLVRDVDGKTFWDALDDAISPRIKEPTAVDESALSTFRSIFQGRSLNKGTCIFLTWLDPSKLLVFVITRCLSF
ncbi:Chalcone-flavonone isomerase family protein [Quillaja saponaria]|uniref:Chalcone-flavonone isomerase family protein n=1 Tax=Quillaja saponaria TaxID=32244 RepID=A0AAD7KZU1_QUISA|nr:Chalcone-flavonone isomerase family protein [Quillaja saponaria]